MIDGSDKSNCQLVFELHNPHVCEMRSNRKQYVKVGNTESTLKTITCGVPQGSTAVSIVY